MRRAFEDILDKSQRKPRELNSDKGSEFTSREFQAMLARRGIHHRLKVGLNDIATLDRAMGTLKEMLARRSADEAAGGDWFAELPAAVDSYNKLDHSALHQHAPAEVAGDDDLRFQLRYENAEKTLDNIENALKRKQKLETMGAFRTLLRPTAFKRRAGVPNWSSEVHTVSQVTPTQVTDQKGNRHDRRIAVADLFWGGRCTHRLPRRIGLGAFVLHPQDPTSHRSWCVAPTVHAVRCAHRPRGALHSRATSHRCCVARAGQVVAKIIILWEQEKLFPKNNYFLTLPAPLRYSA